MGRRKQEIAHGKGLYKNRICARYKKPEREKGFSFFGDVARNIELGHDFVDDFFLLSASGLDGFFYHRFRYLLAFKNRFSFFSSAILL